MALADQEGPVACRSWNDNGATYHQVITHLMENGELRETLKWCEANGKSLVNRAGLQRAVDFTAQAFHAVMVFTDLDEATRARTQWG